MHCRTVALSHLRRPRRKLGRLPLRRRERTRGPALRQHACPMGGLGAPIEAAEAEHRAVGHAIDAAVGAAGAGAAVYDVAVCRLQQQLAVER